MSVSDTSADPNTVTNYSLYDGDGDASFTLNENDGTTKTITTDSNLGDTVRAYYLDANILWKTKDADTWYLMGFFDVVADKAWS